VPPVPCLLRGPTPTPGSAIASALLALAAPAWAALPPFWQSSREIQAVTGSKDVAEALKQAPIERVERAEGGYRVASQACSVLVKVIYEKSTMPGPQKFRIQAGKAECR